MTFTTGERSHGRVVEVVAYLCGHGHGRRYTIVMPADGKGAKGGDVMSRTHAAASAITLRHALLAGHGLQPRRSTATTTATRPAGSPPASSAPSRSKRIKSLAAAVEADVRRFCAFLGVASIEADHRAVRARCRGARAKGSKPSPQAAHRPQVAQELGAGRRAEARTMTEALKQRSAEWYAARCGSLGASDIADALARTRTGWSTSRAHVMNRHASSSA